MDSAVPFGIGLLIFAIVFFLFLICAWVSKVCWGTRCALIFAAAAYLLSFMYVLGFFEVGLMTRSDGYIFFIPRFLIYSIAFLLTVWCVGQFLRHDIFWQICLLSLAFIISLFLWAGSFSTSSTGRWVAFAYAAAGVVAIAYIVWARRSRRDWYANILAAFITVLLIGYFIVWILSAGTLVISFSLETWIYLILDVLYFVVFGFYIIRYMGWNTACKPKCCNVCHRNPCTCPGGQSHSLPMYQQQHMYTQSSSGY